MESTRVMECGTVSVMIDLFHNNFPLAVSSPNTVNWLINVITTKCQLYSNISQILRLYKTWGYYNKFDSTKSLGVCYWCVKIPQYGYVGHGLRLITFYIQKHIAALAMCHNPPLFCDKSLGAPAHLRNWPFNTTVSYVMCGSINHINTHLCYILVWHIYTERYSRNEFVCAYVP